MPEENGTQSVLNVGFIGCDFISNGGNGITLGDGASIVMMGGVRIVGCRCYNRSGGNQGFGILITTGSNNYIVIDNDTRGNKQTPGISADMDTTTRIVKDNIDPSPPF